MQELLSSMDYVITLHLQVNAGNGMSPGHMFQLLCCKQMEKLVATFCIAKEQHCVYNSDPTHMPALEYCQVLDTHPPKVQATIHLNKCYSHVVSQKSSNWLIIATPLNPSHHSSHGFFLSKAENSKVPAAGHKPSKYNNK